MPFIVRDRTLVHIGRPDNTLCTIRLEGGKTLVGTDTWPTYPRCRVMLHPDFYPREIHDLIEEVAEEALKEATQKYESYWQCAREMTDITLEDITSHIVPEEFAAIVIPDPEIGSALTLSISMPGRSPCFRTVSFLRKVADLEGTRAPAGMMVGMSAK